MQNGCALEYVPMCRRDNSQTLEEKLSGYSEELTVDPILDDECRLLKFSDVKITVTDNMTDKDWEEIIDSLESDDCFECYPKIKVSIISPGEDSPIELRNENMEDYVGFDVRQLELNGIPAGEYFFKNIYFSCFIGKYRGYMDIDFSEISTKEELLDTVEENLFDYYEWDFDISYCTTVWMEEH